MINISHFYKLAKAFGLAPYTLQVDANRKRGAFVARIPTFFMILLYPCLVCSVFWKNITVSATSSTVNWIQFIPNVAIFFVVLVTADNSRGTMEAIGVLIQSLDGLLERLQMSLEVSLVVFCGLHISILHFMILNDTKTSSMLYWLAFVIAKIGLLTFNFMFAVYMSMLLERLLLVGKMIEWMIRLQSTQKMTIKNHSEVKISTISVDSPKVFENIYDVIETLQKICSNMNSYFGKKVIFTILTAFICITAQLYRLINNIRQGLKQNRAIWNAAASFSLIITHIVELWAIFSSGHRVKETWSSLVERLHESKRKFGPDEKFKVQIDDLVSIMIFTRVEMKAAGLFNIDLSVITSIASSIATYLVILVQFKMGEVDGPNKSNEDSDIHQFTNRRYD